MLPKRMIAAAGIGLLLLAGCDRSKTASSAHPAAPSPGSVATSSAGNPKTTADSSDNRTNAPATANAAEPPHSSFMIGDARTHQDLAFNFPRARLHIDREQNEAVLYSDDPKSSIDNKYGGNGYYLIIKLTDDAMAHLNGYQWHYRAASSEQQDSTDGIFLQGQRYQLQPWDVTVTFNGESPMVTVMVEGAFYQFDMNQTTHEGTLVEVKGIVSATVDGSK